VMKRDKVIQKLEEISNRVLNDPKTKELAEEYQKKYGRLTGEDLVKTFDERRLRL